MKYISNSRIWSFKSPISWADFTTAYWITFCGLDWVLQVSEGWMKFRRIQTKSILVLIDEVRSWFWTCDQSRVPTCRLLMAICSRMSTRIKYHTMVSWNGSFGILWKQQKKRKICRVPKFTRLISENQVIFFPDWKVFFFTMNNSCTCRTP